MGYKLPPLPAPAYTVLANNIEYANYAQSQVIEYAEQAVAPLLAEINLLKDRAAFWEKCFYDVTK